MNSDKTIQFIFSFDKMNNSFKNWIQENKNLDLGCCRGGIFLVHLFCLEIGLVCFAKGN